MTEQWTMTELVEEVARQIAALPKPSNGQVRAVPDDRTIRYYGTIGLLDRPAAMRGRTAIYGRKHVAQVVAIKRLQTLGRSLAEIQALWPTLDDETLQRMSGVALGAAKASPARAARKDFWKSDVHAGDSRDAVSPAERGGGSLPKATARYVAPPPAPVELRVELAPNLSLSIAMSPDDDVAISPADVAAIRAAAAPLIAELARRRLAMHDEPGREDV